MRGVGPHSENPRPWPAGPSISTSTPSPCQGPESASTASTTCPGSPGVTQSDGPSRLPPPRNPSTRPPSMPLRRRAVPSTHATRARRPAPALGPCPRASKPGTSSARSNTYGNDTPTHPSTATSPVDSTSTGGASRGFWRTHLQDVYARCTLPTETACAASRPGPHPSGGGLCSHTISSHSFSNDAVRTSSWIHRLRRPPRTGETNVTWRRTSSPSSPCLARVFTEAAAAAVAGNDANNLSHRLRATKRPPPPTQPTTPNQPESARQEFRDRVDRKA